MFRSPGVHRCVWRVGGGGEVTLTFACYPNYILVQTFERNVFSVEFFFSTILLVRMPI